jgi:hypothetical protein
MIDRREKFFCLGLGDQTVYPASQQHRVDTAMDLHVTAALTLGGFINGAGCISSSSNTTFRPDSVVEWMSCYSQALLGAHGLHLPSTDES